MTFSVFVFSVLLSTSPSYVDDHAAQQLHAVCTPEIDRLCPEAKDRLSRRECVRTSYAKLSSACQTAIAAAS